LSSRDATVATKVRIIHENVSTLAFQLSLGPTDPAESRVVHENVPTSFLLATILHRLRFRLFRRLSRWNLRLNFNLILFLFFDFWLRLNNRLYFSLNFNF
jgi:hypothetical protein